MSAMETDKMQYHNNGMQHQNEILYCNNEIDNNKTQCHNGGLLFREKVSEAEMVLVGLGEEFDDYMLQKCPGYVNGAERLKTMGLSTLMPAWRGFCCGISADRQGNNAVGMALERLRQLLEPKNYFVVSVATNNVIGQTAWRTGRLVMPCGAAVKKQCAKGCEGVLEEVSEEDERRLRTAFEKLYAGQQTGDMSSLLGKCPVCGNNMVLNNIYVDNYNENGYLEQWRIYMNWLQGTIHKKLLVVELGVGMHFPEVVRWPFEKAAYFNNKAYFYRVNQKLYQLTEELSGKGMGISQNAIEWLCGL